MPRSLGRGEASVVPAPTWCREGGARANVVDPPREVLEPPSPMTDAISRARKLVEDTIQKLGIDPSTTRIPGDAETAAYALKRGSARVIVAVHGAPGGQAEGTFRVIAPVVRVPSDPAKHAPFYKRLLELNGRELQGAAFGLFSEDAVVIIERPVKDLDASEVESAIRGVGRVADRWDDALATEFGTVRSSDGLPST